MRKIAFIFTLILGVVSFQSCTGPEGPRGPQGYPGPASEVFEVTGSFTSNNNYTINVSLNPAIYNSDVVLVYELAGVVSGNTDVWKPLPAVYYLNDGRDLRYFFDFTRNDVQIYLDVIDPSFNIPDPYRINKTFRIVIVPGYFSLDGIDTSDINAVMNALSLTSNSVQLLD